MTAVAGMVGRDGVALPRAVWPSELPRRLRRLTRAGRVADWLSAVSPSRNAHLMPSSVHRIGVLMQWGIGDAILATPLLRGLRAAYPNASIELIGRPWLRELFADTILADEVHELAPPWTRYRRKYRVWQPVWFAFLRELLRLRRVPFDVVASVRCDPREVLQIRLLHARFRAGYGERAGRRWLDVDLGVPPHFADGAHASVAAARIAEALTGSRGEARPWLPVPGRVVDAAVDALTEAGYTGGRIVAVCPYAGEGLREWNVRGFERVIEKLPAEVGFIVVIADPSRPVMPLRVPADRASLIWRTSLSELRGLLAITDLLICNDSGVMHMASACGCPAVAVFGPAPKSSFEPLGESNEVVIVEPMPCRPCFDLCIYRRPICMEQIGPEMVSSAVARAFARLGPPRIGSRPAPVVNTQERNGREAYGG